jgi:hypothetical protein
MTEKAKINQIVADWKKLETAKEKEAFLKKVKAGVAAKSASELAQGVKAIGEVVHDLHGEVMQSSLETAAIEVFPADDEEARLVEALLARMGVRYKVA